MTRRTGASCPSAIRSLGRIAFTVRSGLELLDLASCRVTTLPGADQPRFVPGVDQPAFSPDGRWLAYTQRTHGQRSRPVVVPVGGGQVRAPLGGRIAGWSWGPRDATLYGLTATGSLVASSPTGTRRTIAAHLTPAHGYLGGLVLPSVWLLVAPDGRSVAVARGRCGPHPFGEIDRINVRTGARTAILRQAGSPVTLAQWSPDGRWLLFWPVSQCSDSIAADGMPLEAVSADGGNPAQVISHMLLYPDFLTWCDERLIAAGGSRVSRQTNIGSTLIATTPPARRAQTIAPAQTLSWVSPSCAPGGQILVAAAGPSNSGQAAFGLEHRSIWLLRPDGARIRRLAVPAARAVSDEAPRFSAHGRWIMFIRTHVVDVGRSAISRDQIMLAPTSGGPAIPVLGFTSGDFSYYDHFYWPQEVAWDQPATKQPANAGSGTVIGSISFVGGPENANHQRAAGTVLILNRSGEPVTQQRVRQGQRFRIVLPAGTYTIRVRKSYGCPAKRIQVRADRRTRVTVDTGCDVK